MRSAGTSTRVVASVTAALVVTGALVAGQRAGRGAPAGRSPSSPTAMFTDVARAAGIDVRHVNGGTPQRHLLEIMSGGGLFFDYDNDGWLDVVLIDGGSLLDAAVDATARDRLFRNRGNGTFEEASTASGLRHRPYGMGACAADYDNDGSIDLYVTRVGTNSLYHNDQGRRFTEVTTRAGVGGAPLFSASCAFGDIDADGDVDLFVANYVDARIDNDIFCGDATTRVRVYCHPLNFAPLADVLYRNNGDGTFTDISRDAGIASQKGNGLGAVFGDYDGDGRIDLFVANDTTPDFLYHNEGGGRFREVGLVAGVSVGSDGRARAGMGTDFGDYDGDGDLDLFVTNHELEAHTLFRNLGDGLFEDATFASGVGPATLPFVGFGTGFLDLDNDGDLDLPIANGHVMNSPEHFRPGATEAQRNLLLENVGGGRFRNATTEAGPGFAEAAISRTLAAGDIDNDGDLDLLVTNNGGPVTLLRNDLDRRAASLLVRLVGTRSNRSGVGARLQVTAGGRTLVREVRAGGSYLGQHDLRVHVGLGAASRIDRLEVRWPSGQVERVTGAMPNEVITVTEGKGLTSRAPLAR